MRAAYTVKIAQVLAGWILGGKGLGTPQCNTLPGRPRIRPCEYDSRLNVAIVLDVECWIEPRGCPDKKGLANRNPR